jgi:hypothetical protein
MGAVIPKLRQSARGQGCTVRIPGVCNGNTETTVLAHLPSGQKAMATKSDDWNACFSCSACHEAIDQHRLSKEDELRTILRALQRTQRIWFVSGLMTFPVTEHRARQSEKILARPAHFRR